MSQKILITGTSAGFGAMMVEALLSARHQVAASMRDVKGRNKPMAEKLERLGAKVVEIDVTDQGSVDRGVTEAIRALGGLDCLVNNAGVGVSGFQEAFTPEDFQRLFAINVFGVQRMNRAVIPCFREQRKGLLMHISSLLGRITVPFYGPYNASKWALEALAENYRAELSSFGIECCVVEPGGYPTTFMERLMRPSDQSRIEAYGPMKNLPEETLRGFETMLKQSPQQDPKNVATAVVGLVGMSPGTRPFRTVVDSIGMGAGVIPYNEQLQGLTEAIYGNMGISGMLKVKV